tara:strand:+ start:153 stop:473 length:321 start_codon:yes stop_codon:yes gene_type:complete
VDGCSNQTYFSEYGSVAMFLNIVLRCDMPKIVEIKDKMGKPTLQEVISRLDAMFENMVYRGEDKLNIILASISFCLSQLSLEFGDKEVAKLVDELLAQYIDKSANK